MAKRAGWSFTSWTDSRVIDFAGNDNSGPQGDRRQCYLSLNPTLIVTTRRTRSHASNDGSFAQYERTLIRGRMLAGKAQKVANGGYGGGRPAYGLQASGGALVANPEESAIVEIVKAGRKDGSSYREIAAMLKRSGLAPLGWRMEPESDSTDCPARRSGSARYAASTGLRLSALSEP